METGAVPCPVSCVTVGKSHHPSEPRSLFCKRGATIAPTSSDDREEEIIPL